MTQCLGSPKIQYFDTSTGTFLVGGKLHTYEVGTTTAKATYTTSADAIANTSPQSNPVILNTRGEAVVWFNGATKLVLTDSLDNEIWSITSVGSTAVDVLDSNSANQLVFVTTNNAVNNWSMTNAITGGSPIIATMGGDTNVNGIIATKGTATLAIQSSATTISGTLTNEGTLVNNAPVYNYDAVINITTSHTVGAATFDSTVEVAGALTAIAAVNFLPAGTILSYGGAAAPTGYLPCAGAAVSRTTYPALFAAIGTTWGVGNGTTTFNVPNFQRRAIVGSGGSGTATLANTVGAIGGTETVTIAEANIPPNVPVGSRTCATAQIAAGSDLDVPGFGAGAGTFGPGGGTAMGILQPSAVVLMIIRAV